MLTSDPQSEGSIQEIDGALALICRSNGAELRSAKVYALPETRKAAHRLVQAAQWHLPPRTAGALGQLTVARTTHGRRIKDKRAKAKRRAEVGRKMRAELPELEE